MNLLKKSTDKYNWTSYIWQIVTFWTLIFILSSYWNISNIYNTLINNAELHAIVALDKDIQYRQWNAKHGGVYVPVCDYGIPNPYLKGLAKRDIISLEGDTLTMINPAYMTRQVHEAELSDIGVKGHMTSLNLIRIENAADEWETAALHAFDEGLEKISSIEKIDTVKFFRFMKPLIVEKNCLKCHAEQGYKIGDIRGGISVSIPIESMLHNAYAEMINHGLIEGIIWIIGLVGIGFGFKTAKKNEEQFKALTQLSPAGIYLTDLNAKCTYVNERWCEMTGLTFDEAMSEGWSKGLHPDDRDHVFSSWNKTVKSEEKWESEYRFQTPEGKTIWVHGVANPLVKDGNIIGYIGLNTDITQRKQSDLLQSVLYQISDSTHTTNDLNTLYKSIYTCLQQVLDVTNFYIAIYDNKTELLSFPFLRDEYDSRPDPKPLGNGLTEYVISTGESYFLEGKDIQKLNQEGKIDIIGTLPSQWLGSPLIVDGNVIGVIAVQNYKEFDVYERNDSGILIYVSEQIALAIAHMQSVKELEVEKTYLEELFSNSPEAVALVDIESNILQINPEFTSLFGYAEDEIIGKNIDEVLVGQEQMVNAKKNTREVRAGHRVFFDSIRRKKDGTNIPVSILGSPIKYREGVLAVYAIYRDISERKKAELKLRNSERKHRRLSDQLTDANMMKETLLDILSHDLKNSAGVILGFSELLMEENGDNEIVTGIRDSSNRLLEVIDNTSILSKVSLGEKIEFQSLDLVQIIEQVSDEYKPQFANKGMQLTLNLPDSLQVRANPIIAEIFKNYMNNALKYASDGKRLLIDSKTNDKSVTIRFTDHGPTVPKEKREIIFKRGSQLETGTKRGRGLGLAIAKRIADAHNGDVWVEPNEPTGNRFCLRLPLT